MAAGTSDDLTNAKSNLYLAEALRRQAVGDGTWRDLVGVAETLAYGVDNGALRDRNWTVTADFAERRPQEERKDIVREQGAT